MKISIPRISNSKEIIDVVYKDLGNMSSEKSPKGKSYYRSSFKFGEKQLYNDFYSSAGGNIGLKRYASDKALLQKHDLNLDMGIVE